MTLSVFGVSGLLLLMLLAVKLLEEKLGRKTFISNFFSKGDAHLFQARTKLDHLVHDNKQKTIFFFLFHLPERIEKFFQELKKKAHDRYFEVSSRVRGKQTLNSRADVSPFIRNIGPKDGEQKQF